MKNETLALRCLPALTLLLLAGAAFGNMKVNRLRCESLENPLGIDAPAPKLSWALESSEKDQRQSAYQVLVASTPQALAKDQGDLWDSGKVASAETLHIPYQGQPLRSGQAAVWKVRTWDAEGKASAWSQPASFDMGLLNPSDWGAKWIGRTTDVAVKPAPFLRKEIALAGGIKRARAYVCGLGYYELRINGRKVGDHVLDPGFTRFDKRALYSTYDVTKALKSGENAFGLVLGNGWYNVQPLAVWFFEKAPWRASPKVMMRVEVEMMDGTKQTLVTDETWRTSTGPITEDSLYIGEDYDARLERKGWDSPRFDDSAWDAALVVAPPGGKLVAQTIPPIRVTKTLKPVRITQPKPGVYVVDFGQNFAGYPRLKVKGTAGATVSMRCGERLHKDGMLDQADIAKYMIKTDPPQRFQTNRYTLKGVGEEVWEPRFSYQGFQYVEVTGFPGELRPENLEGLFIHTDVARVGEFECSNPLLGKILDSARWAYLSNLESIFTDCPHREKNGWTGDAQLASELGLYNYDSTTVYRKWLDDLADDQVPNQKISVIIPNSGWGTRFIPYAPAWDAAYFEIPWNVYLYTGDKELLAKHYDGYTNYLDWLTAQGKDFIVEGDLGDWCPYKMETPTNLTSTAYLFQDAIIAAKAATLLGKTDDAKKYRDLADNVRRAYNAKFFDPQTGLYANGSQTAQSAALFFDLAEAKDRPAILKNLLDNVAKCDDHIDSGILGSKYVLNVLSDEGHGDVAYRMASQKTLPSWGWWIEQGATTMWEQWNGTDSQNHIMFGEIAAWFYKALAGIKPDPAAPGFKHILIAPQPVGDLTWAKSSHESPRGIIKSHWTKEKGVFTLDVTIPANTTATVTLPATQSSTIQLGGKAATPKSRTEGQAAFEIGSGSYRFTVR
ncbi:alpha-rhamnosidase [bacterium]|nr:MAG: alpha-rhamnosidase [bacterium]